MEENILWWRRREGWKGFPARISPHHLSRLRHFSDLFQLGQNVPVPTRTLFTQRGGCGTGGDICILTLFWKETAFVFYEGQGQKDKVPPMVYCSAIFRLYTVLGRQELWDNLRQNDQLGLQAPFEKCWRISLYVVDDAIAKLDVT